MQLLHLLLLSGHSVRGSQRSLECFFISLETTETPEHLWSHEPSPEKKTFITSYLTSPKPPCLVTVGQVGALTRLSLSSVSVVRAEAHWRAWTSTLCSSNDVPLFNYGLSRDWASILNLYNWCFASCFNSVIGEVCSSKMQIISKVFTHSVSSIQGTNGNHSSYIEPMILQLL